MSICRWCCKLFKAPVQLTCGHSICKICAQNYFIADKGEIICRVCLKPTFVDTIEQLIPNISLSQLIDTQMMSLSGSQMYIENTSKSKLKQDEKLNQFIGTLQEQLSYNFAQQKTKVDEFVNNLLEQINVKKEQLNDQLQDKFSLAQNNIQQQTLSQEMFEIDFSLSEMQDFYKELQSIEIVSTPSATQQFKFLQQYYHSKIFKPGKIIRDINQDPIFSYVEKELVHEQVIRSLFKITNNINVKTINMICSIHNYENIPIWYSAGIISAIQAQIQVLEYKYIQKSQQFKDLTGSTGIEEYCEQLSQSSVQLQDSYLSYQRIGQQFITSINSLAADYITTKKSLLKSYETIQNTQSEISSILSKRVSTKKQVILNQKIESYDHEYYIFESEVDEFQQQELNLFKQFRKLTKQLQDILPNQYQSMYYILNFPPVTSLEPPVLLFQKQNYNLKQIVPSDQIGIAIGVENFKAEQENQIDIAIGKKYYVFKINDWAEVCSVDSTDQKGYVPWKCLKVEE